MEEIIDYDEESSLWDEYMEMPLVGGALFEGVAREVDYQNGTQETEIVSSQQLPTQSNLVIGEIPVTFPGTPYQTQQMMMENIIRSLNNNDNSLIESPTGSGKTLALLCAVLAWKKHEYLRDQNAPTKTIFYCTKTHAQISTVIKELRKTDYVSSDSMPRLKVTILGSRAQMCVNESVIADGIDKIDDSCTLLEKNFRKNNNIRNPPARPLQTCQFYTHANEDYFSTNQDGYSPEVIRDIEDLRTTAQRTGCCAFFGSRRQLCHADLVICPYNYIISSYIRRSVKIGLQNSIVIFDEGHNLEKALCAEGSMSLSGKLFGEIFLKCRQLSSLSNVSPSVQEASTRLFNTFFSVHRWMKSYEHDTQNIYVPSGMRVVAEMTERGLGRDDLAVLKSSLNNVSGISVAEEGPTLDKRTSQRIQKVITVLEYLYKNEQIEENYHLRLENVVRSGRVVEVKISVMCINPALVFNEISSQTSSIVITSGTLTPLETYARELSIPFNHPLSLEQTIPAERYWVAKVAVTPVGPLPKLTLPERSKSSVKIAVGELLVRICEVVPNGVIAFFPSKDCINSMMEDWEFSISQTGSIMERIRGLKHVVNECEMREPQRARTLLQEFCEKSRQGTGALLLGVHRGKVSEGVDFSDNEARAVINIGIPYAPVKAPAVAAKQDYTYNRLGDTELFWRWYKTDAFRAVNQGLGRSIRHRNDWGAIIMVDPRFLDEESSEFIPPWIESASRRYEDPVNGDFERMIDDLRIFVTTSQML